MPIIHWFRRDLRLLDNTALNAAIREGGGAVIPVFILDDSLLRGKDVAPARIQFMLDCLRDLDNSLRVRGSQLVLRRGDPQAELARLAHETGAQAVYFNRDYTPLARQRDERVTRSLQASGVLTRTFTDQVIHEPGEVMTKGGKPYTVFTPYKRTWLSLPHPNVQRLEMGEWFSPPCESLISDLQSPIPGLPPGGEQAALKQMEEFIHSGRLSTYDTQRNQLALDGTSRLSAHLRFGTLSARGCLQAAMDIKPHSSDGAEAWISELIWREFYTQVLYHFPHVDHANFKSGYEQMRWGSGDPSLDETRFAAWCEGRTGYPVVDAAMRQLHQTAWMHNRARMIVASFLTKDLLLDWRMGESYFMQKLVDGDPASNNGGWQWAASTGTDAQPYFRIFNPVLQGQRFDPQGDYVRAFVPELARVPQAYIHTPWEMPIHLQRKTGCIIGGNYPVPIVDHATQKEEILRRFKEIRP